jgi:hypothetical protein
VGERLVLVLDLGAVLDVDDMQVAVESEITKA